MRNIYTLLIGLLIFVSCLGYRGEKGIAQKKDNAKSWELVWEDNFDRKDIFSTGIWSKIPRGKSDWQKNMSSHESLYRIEKGNLILSGIKNNVDYNDSSDYLTGGVYTKGNKYFGTGRIEVRCKLEATQGSWPAIWMLPQKGKWPEGGEIDLMERLNFDNYIYQTVHTSYTKMNRDSPKNHTIFEINPNDYNVYAVEIYQDELKFFVNEKHTFSYPRVQSRINQFPFIENPFYLLIDMQLGGSWVGEVKPFDGVVNMYIDWVRYYKHKNTEK